MKFAILYSKTDQAGVNIANELKNHYLPTIPIIELKKESIYNENIDKDPRLKNIDFIIFATKHQSKAKVPTLSLHAPGNWRNADFGGKPGKICNTSSQILKYLFQKLNDNTKNYEVTLECTHHGPYLDKPCLFIEIGSEEKAWGNSELGKIIAKTISDLQKFTKQQTTTAIAIGGPHYCNNFNKIQLSKKSGIAISHIIPEYCLPLTSAMLTEAIEKTSEQVDLVLLDWKGCGKSEDREKVIQVIESLDLDWKRTKEIIK